MPYEMSDVDALAEIMGDERVMRHIGKGARDREEVGAIVKRCIQRWRDVGMGWWTIRLAESMRVTGQICLQPTKDLPGEIEVGYALSPLVWGRGYAQEALEEVLRYGHQERAIARIVATVRPQNEHSIALLRRCRFDFETAVHLRHKLLHLYVHGDNPS